MEIPLLQRELLKLIKKKISINFLVFKKIGEKK